MSPSQIEEENKKETTNESLVIDSGATAHYYPTEFDEESPNDGRSQVHSSRQGNTKLVVVEFKNELNASLLLVGTLVWQQEHPVNLLTHRLNREGRITQTYARTTCHVRPKQPSPTQIRLSVAGNIIWTVDISSNYLHVLFDTPLAELPAAEWQQIGRDNYARNFCHTHGNDVTSHHAYQCRNEDARCRPW